MQVKTNRGPVTLTAGSIRRGMVFKNQGGDSFVLQGSEFNDKNASECNLSEALAADVASDKLLFLGCDPRIASRVLTEQFGVSTEMDATTVGFARLRDGGAIDLYRSGNLRTGMIFQHKSTGSRVTIGTVLDAARMKVSDEAGPNWRFVDVDPSEASVHTLTTLCCGVRDVLLDDDGQHLICTLPVGHHVARAHYNYLTARSWPTLPSPTVVGVDMAVPDSPVFDDRAGKSPKGFTWPFEVCGGLFRLEAGTTSVSCLASFDPKRNAMRLSFGNVPAGEVFFALRDMFSCLARVRFTLHAVNGKSARYEVTPNDVATSSSPRLRDATNIEARVVDVRRVETSDEWWTKEKPATAADIIRRRLNQPIVYAVPKGGAHEELTNWLAAEMSKAISGDQGQYAIGPVHQAFTYPIVPTTKTTDYINVWRPSALMTAIAPREVAPVPNGCDPARWRAVVNVIQADVQEAAQHRKRHGESYDRDAQLHDYLTRAAERMSAYAVLRFVHRYDAKEASRRACEKDGGTVYYSRHERLCRVYEAG